MILVLLLYLHYSASVQHHDKTNNLHMPRKTKAQIGFVETAKLISAFAFVTRMVQFLYFLNPKFPVCSHLLCLCRSVRKPVLGVFRPGLTLTGLYVTTFFFFFFYTTQQQQQKKKCTIIQYYTKNATRS